MLWVCEGVLRFVKEGNFIVKAVTSQMTAFTCYTIFYYFILNKYIGYSPTKSSTNSLNELHFPESNKDK